MLRSSIVFLALFAITSCTSNNGGTPTVDEYVVDCDVTDGGQVFASDENFVKFVEAESANRVRTDPCLSPKLTAPSPSIRLDGRTPPTFTFLATNATCTAALSRPSAPVYGCLSSKPGRPLWSRLLLTGASVLEGTAEAHCGAFSGENYYFRFKRSGESNPVYSAMLSVTSFVPDASIWQRALLGRSGQTLSLTIERGVFLRGDLNEGPYVQPQPYSFTVGP